MKKILIFNFLIVFSLFFTINCKAEDSIQNEFDLLKNNEKITSFDAEIVYVGDNTVRIEDSQGNRYDIDSTFEFGNSKKMQEGMQVKAEIIKMEDGSARYVISDINRLSKMWILILIFFLTIIFLLKKQGIKALINLIITFIFIIFFIIPLILKGFNPLIVTIIGTSMAMFIMFFTLYGKTKKTLAICLATLLSLIIATLFSWFFIHFTYLTGFVSDETTFIMTAGYLNIDMKGLLLAAFLIGIMGTLDDIIINQVSITESLQKINSKINFLSAYKEAIKVGRDHMSSMINTLIFAYAGAAFPLMILFYLHNPPFDSISSILNNEIVATEIVRMIVGSMSLLLATPIATYIAVKIFLKPNK